MTLAALWLPSLVHAQGAFVSGSAQGTVNGALRSLAGATVTVCGASKAGLPCAPPLANTLFSDSALTQPVANPTTTDANGNYNFAMAAGTYTLTITASGFGGSTQQVTVACGIGSCTATSLTVSGTTTLKDINHQKLIDGTTYPLTGAGFQQAVTDCIADSACSLVDASQLGVVTTTTTTALTKPMELRLGATTVISGTSDPVVSYGNNGVKITGVAGEGTLGTVSVIKSTVGTSRVLAPTTPASATLSFVLRDVDLWNSAASSSTAAVWDMTNVNQSRCDNAFIQRSTGAGDLVFVTTTGGLGAFYNNFINCRLFGASLGPGYHFTNVANSQNIVGGKVDSVLDCALVDGSVGQVNEIGFHGTVCEAQAGSVIHTIGSVIGVRWFGGRWESSGGAATLFNISASSLQIGAYNVFEAGTQTCGTTNSVVTIVGEQAGFPCASNFDIFTPRNISAATMQSGGFVSSTAIPASSGIVRLANAGDAICWRNGANNADLCMPVNSANQINATAFSAFLSGQLRGTLNLADQGSVCTNGELALSAGWQSTGSATVTAVAGNGQTCSWTITTGTTTAANPTVTDTLTNALPTATTVCEMNIHGGTHTAAAGEGFQQTTLSATAPIFTFNGTPTAGGTTYFVTRRCGP